MNIGEKVAYLKGLAEGIEISSDTREGKLLKGMLDILGDIAKSLRDSEEAQGNLLVYAEELDEDLGILEKAFLKNHGMPDIDDDEDTEGVPPADDEFYNEDENEYEYFGDLEGSAKINCPSCGELLLFDLDDIIEESGYINCPECNAEIAIVGEFSSESGGCCGGCGNAGVAGQEGDGGN